MNAKLAIGAGSLLLVPVVLLGAAGAGVVTGAKAQTQQTTVGPAHAIGDIPPDYYQWYRQAAVAECPGLSWTILAAIGRVESGHGRSEMPGVDSGANGAGAQGPMQFLPATFETYAEPIPPGGKDSPFDPVTAIHAAARLLCANGAPQDLRRAIFAYNHATWYVNKVLAEAAFYQDLAEDATTDQGRSLRTDFPPEQANIADPSGTGGSVTPRTATLYHAIKTADMLTPGASCYGQRPETPNSDHPRGRACDIFFDPHNAASVHAGWELARWLVTHQALYGIHYLIWQGQQWSTEHPAWNTYHSNAYGCPNPANLTGCHFNHIHISLL